MRRMIVTWVLVTILLIVVFESIVLLSNADLLWVRVNFVLQMLMISIFGYWSFRKSGTYLSAPLIFVVAIYFWHSTFLTGHYLNLGEMFEYSGKVLTIGEYFVPQASAMVSLSMAFSIGGTLYGFSRQLRKWKGGKKVTLYQPFATVANQYAWLCFLSFISISLCYLWFEGYETFDDNYLSLYTDYSGSFLYRLYQSTKFLGVGIILILFASVRSKRTFLVAVVLTTGLIFMNVLMGSRSMPFIYALTLLISIDLFAKKIPLVILSSLAVFASAGSFIIDHIRLIGLGFKIFDLSLLERPINLLHVFWNAGGTVQTVLRTMEFSSETGLLYGRSIADAVIYLLPRAFIDGLGFGTGFTTPSEWLIQMSPDVPFGGGMGFSLVAEMYLNFGIVGCIAFALLGWLLGSKYYEFIKYGNIFSGLHAFNVAIMLALHMRSDIGTYLRALFYGAIIIEILRWLSRRRSMKNLPFWAQSRKQSCK